MSTSSRRGAILALALLVAAASASAQDIRARVQGLVSDASGGILPGATVVLTNDGTGVTATRTTSASGRYLFDFVESGTYSVSAELAGFKTTVQKGVRVQQRGDLTVDLKLEVGGIEETITVTEATTTVQFNTATSRPDDRAGDGEGPALRHPQPAPARHARPHHDPAREHDRDPALPPPHGQRDGHRRRHQVPERRAARRHAAHRRQQARLHAADGRGQRVHAPAELGGRRVRPQRGRHRDRHHEVGLERREGLGLLLRPRRQPQRDERPGDPAAQRQPLLERRGDDRPADQEEQALPVRRLRRDREHAVPGQQLLAPDRARAPGRLLAVLQRQRHAARHLRPAHLAHRQRRAGARPVPGQQDPLEPLGPRGRADPGGPVGRPTTPATT